MMDEPLYVVIVAEDEPLIRLLAVNVLTDAGFTVIEAPHAEAALAALHARPGGVHLLFTDIHIPGTLNGLQLAHCARKLWPKMGLLIASGEYYPDQAELPHGSIFLRKPYDLDHVVAHARTLVAV
jgi:DNA-binding NtrC family response regulator